jgi:hypothetical protein
VTSATPFRIVPQAPGIPKMHGGRRAT